MDEFLVSPVSSYQHTLLSAVNIASHQLFRGAAFVGSLDRVGTKSQVGEQETRPVKELPGSPIWILVDVVFLCCPILRLDIYTPTQAWTGLKSLC